MRRLRVDLMLCFKMLKGFVDVDASELCERVAPDSVTRGHRYKLVHPSVRINVRQYFFAVRIIPVWNSLSSNVEAESISCFKARLSREGLTKFMNIWLFFFYFILVLLYLPLFLCDVTKTLSFLGDFFLVSQVRVKFGWRYKPKKRNETIRISPAKGERREREREREREST